ncbi:uncharacterized protein LOC124258110 isoform X2 [Haliotis rubra]|uniref:uncharacterized protein LOC124258110 isoform X2 n=1 Tax=Haliotis rubra TaxID=36100 RepID=UPI001EE556F0|nr:uncharacterized protein LOC124258110 isoform X2 [Haliotis rubra]
MKKWIYPTMWKISLLTALLCIFVQVSDSKMYMCTKQDSPSSVSFITCYSGCCGSNYTTHCCNSTTTANINVSTTTMPTPAPSVSRWMIVSAFVGSVIVAAVIATIILYFVCCSQRPVPKDDEAHQFDSKMAEEGYTGIADNGYDPKNKPFNSLDQDQQRKY